jgi:chromate transporter
MLPAEVSTGEGARLARLGEVVAVFGKLGIIGFGGPAAHIALMDDEVVRKRGWLTRDHFLDLLAATNLVPGPNSTEMAIHLGYLRASLPGLIAGGVAFILPAMLTVLVIAWAYKQYGALPQVNALLYGIKPAIIAVIAQATYRLGQSALSDWRLRALCALAFIATALGLDTVVVMLVAGVVGIALYAPPGWLRLGAPALLGWGILLQAPAQASDNRLLALALFFLKVGSLLFGSGYVLVAFIEREVVNELGWLTPQQLVDAIAVGQMTPGPVLTTATFIGYLVAGVPGAVVSTVAIFVPSFVIVVALTRWLPRLRASQTASAFLRGVNVGVVAVMLLALISLGRAALVDAWTWLIALVALALLLRTRVDTTWVLAGAALLGLALRLAAPSPVGPAGPAQSAASAPTATSASLPGPAPSATAPPVVTAAPPSPAVIVPRLTLSATTPVPIALTAEAISGGMTAYVSSAFSMTVPSDWQPGGRAADTFHIYEVTLAPPPGGGMAGPSLGIVSQYVEADLPLITVAGRFSTHEASHLAAFRELQTWPDQVGGRDGFWFLYEWQDPASGTVVTSISLLVRDGTTVWRLHGAAPREVYVANREVFERMMRSFEVR